MMLSEASVSIKEVSPEEWSLRELSRVLSVTGRQGHRQCLCKPKCGTNKCPCRASQVLVPPNVISVCSAIINDQMLMKFSAVLLSVNQKPLT